MADDIVDNNLHNVIYLCSEMLELADQGDRFRRDAGCGVVYGTLRDVAYKIRELAEKELVQHSRKSKSSPRKRKQGESEGQSDHVSGSTKDRRTLDAEERPQA